MAQRWEADPKANITHRIGKSPQELDVTPNRDGCPDVLQLDNGDVAIIGRRMTGAYANRLIEGVSIMDDEELVVIPASTWQAARSDS